MGEQYKKQVTFHYAPLQKNRNKIKMGGTSSSYPNDNNRINSRAVQAPLTEPWCSSANHIVNKQFMTYSFPNTTHLGMKSTLIESNENQYLGIW